MSHAMGTTSGEPCCVICYAAPGDAIVEDPCDQSIRLPERRRMIATAIAAGDLHPAAAPDERPADPGERRRLRMERARASILRAYDGDLTVDEIARRLQINSAHVAKVLRDHGLHPSASSSF